jgi:hypothetical protein
MKTLLKLGEMLQYLPTQVKDAVHHVAKDSGQKTDDLELHRHSHSEKAAVNGLDPKSRRALKYVSYRTQDRDDEIVIPETINLTEFKKYGHVLVNHNYSLLPVGSDVDISADDYGIKALTEYADTGAGTLANVVWALVSQGHLKSSSIGFVPTSFTKPGSRDWDHVANQLQSNWKEFDKGRAEKSISRIITGGVLLEHSDVSVPCNADAELISVCKGMNLDGKVCKQLGWEMKDGILVNKAETEPEPCGCDECGYMEKVVAGSKCPECKTGDMKPKAKEKAIVVISKGGAGSGNFGHEGRPGERGGSSEGGGSGMDKTAISNAIAENKDTINSIERHVGSGEKVSLLTPHLKRTYTAALRGMIAESDRILNQELASRAAKTEASNQALVAQNLIDRVKIAKEDKGFHSHAIEKPNPHMPGGSFSACVLLMEDKGHDAESAKKICGALQADAGGKGLTEAETKAVREVIEKGDLPGHEFHGNQYSGGGGGGGEETGGRMSDADRYPTGFSNRAEYERSARFIKDNRSKVDDAISTLFDRAYENHVQDASDLRDDIANFVRNELKVKDDLGQENVYDYIVNHVQTEIDKETKSFHAHSVEPSIKLIRPAPSVKILFAPPTGDTIAAQVGDAVERALSRRTGKIL